LNPALYPYPDIPIINQFRLIIDSSLRGFTGWPLPEIDAEEEVDETKEYVYKPPVIEELMCVNAATLPLFCKLHMRSVLLAQLVSDRVNQESIIELETGIAIATD